MLRIHMTRLIANYGAFKYLLHVVLLISIRHLINLRGNIFNIPLFILLLYCRLRSLYVKWRSRLFISSTKSSRPILWIAAFTWRNNHYLLLLLLLSKHWRLNLLTQELLLIVIYIGEARIVIILSLKLMRKVLHKRWLLVQVIRVTESGSKDWGLRVVGHLWWMLIDKLRIKLRVVVRNSTTETCLNLLLLVLLLVLNWRREEAEVNVFNSKITKIK